VQNDFDEVGVIKGHGCAMKGVLCPS
jgi:hypothetical protein